MQGINTPFPNYERKSREEGKALLEAAGNLGQRF
jgi:hypothetical protein